MIREYTAEDVASMNAVWNEVVEEGTAFPQEEFLDLKTGLHSLRHRVIAVWPRMMPGRSLASIFCTRTISDAVGISAMPVMRYLLPAVDFTLGSSW